MVLVAKEIQSQREAAQSKLTLVFNTVRIFRRVQPFNAEAWSGKVVYRGYWIYRPVITCWSEHSRISTNIEIVTEMSCSCSFSSFMYPFRLTLALSPLQLLPHGITCCTLVTPLMLESSNKSQSYWTIRSAHAAKRCLGMTVDLQSL